MTKEKKRQNQNTNITRASQNFFRGGEDILKTDPLIKILVMLFIIIIPMLLFILFLQPENALFHSSVLPTVAPAMWVNWLVIIGWTIVSQFIITLLVNKFEKVNEDMFVQSFFVMGIMSGWYGLPHTNLWRILWSLLMGIAFQSIGRIIFGIRKFVPMLRQARTAQKKIMEMQMAMQQQKNPGEAPKTKEDYAKQQARRQEEQMRAQTEMLDQMLREQGIDIDALDEEFGTELDTGKLNSFEVRENRKFNTQNNSASTIKDINDEIIEVVAREDEEN